MASSVNLNPLILTVPRPSALSSVSDHRIPAKLPEFGCLKIRPSSVTRSLGSVSRKRSSRFSRLTVACEAQDTAVIVPTVTDDTWQSLVLESDSPVLVEFWAPWCGPCRMMHPVIDEVAMQYVGKLKCYKINTDDSPSTASRYGVRSIPTIMIFKNGEKKDAIIGAVPNTTLTNCIERFL